MKHFIKYTIILLASLTSIFGFAQTGSPIHDNIGENYFTQSPQGSDSLLQFSNSALPSDAYWITDNTNPGTDFGGTLPTDIFYLEVPNGNDKIYVYGKRNIVVIDAVTQETIDIIETMSSYSQYYPAIEQTYYLNYSHFAYNPNDNILYCALENSDLIVIDLTNNQIEDRFTYEDDVCGKYEYYHFFLKFDKVRNWIYYAMSTNLQNELFIYDANNNHSLKGDLYFGTDENIRGLEINEADDEFYLSINNEFKRVVFDPAEPIIKNDNVDFYLIGSYNDWDYTGNMLYVKWENPQEEDEEKLFCFPSGSLGGATLNYFIVDLLDPNKPVETQQCPEKVTATCFDGTDKVCISYVSNNDQADYREIDVNDYSYGPDINTHAPNIDETNHTLDLEMFGDKVLITKTAEITMYDPTSGDVTPVKSGENHYFSRIAVAPDELTAYVINTWGAGIDAINQSGQIDYSLNLGGIAYHACFNKHNGRIYFYNKHIQETGKVYVFNTADYSFTIVDIEGRISDIAVYPYSENDGKVLVSTYNNSHFIKVIQDDELLDNSQWIELDHGYVNEMYISPEDPGLQENYLYCLIGKQDGTENTGIEIGKFTANGFSLFHFLTYNTIQQLEGYFTANSESGSRDVGNVVYAALTDGTTTIKKLVSISIVSPDLPPVVTDYNIEQNAIDIVYNKNSSNVFVAHSYSVGDVEHNKVTVFSTKDASIETVNFQATILDIESNSLNGFIYVLQNGGLISKLSGTTISSNPIADLYMYSSSMKFNVDNSMLYVHVPFIKLDCTYGDGGVYEIFDNNTGNPQIQFFKNGNFLRPRYTNGSIIPTSHDIVFDTEAHRLYYGGGGHSNIQGLTIESFYRIRLHYPLTWLSIPRHLRPSDPQLTPTPIVFAQENIAGGYTYLNLDYNKIDADPPMVYARWDDEHAWHYNDVLMENIHSARGYKLEFQQNPLDELYLELEGSVQDPNTVFPLYCHEENWTGYYLYEVQSVFNALGNALPYVYHIEHEDYTCYRYNFPVPDCNAKSATDYPPGTWICDGTPNIRFGEMVIIKPYQDIPNFSWHQSNDPPSDYTRSEVVYYTYDELADYSTFVIELDTTQENPQEIGAFVNDTCVGASSVIVGDSVIVLRAYLGEQPGDSVVFEEHYASKSTNNIHVADYYVLNPESGIKEKRVVKTGEGRDVFIISFRKGQKDNRPALNDIEFNIWPNPASGSLYFSFMLEEDAIVNISIFDINGKLVAKPVNEAMQAGRLSGELSLADFSGGKLKPGVYLLKAKIGDSLLTRKVIVK